MILQKQDFMNPIRMAGIRLWSGKIPIKVVKLLRLYALSHDSQSAKVTDVSSDSNDLDDAQLKNTLQHWNFMSSKANKQVNSTIWYNTIEEFNVDSKAEYSALSSTRSQKKKLKQTTPVPL